jgi:hypothetical protein
MILSVWKSRLDRKKILPEDINPLLPYWDTHPYDDDNQLLTDDFKEINCLNFMRTFSNNIDDVMSVRIVWFILQTLCHVNNLHKMTWVMKCSQTYVVYLSSSDIQTTFLILKNLSRLMRSPSCVSVNPYHVLLNSWDSLLEPGIYFMTGLWSSGQSSWLQIQRSEFDSRRYQIFWEEVSLKRGQISLVTTIEELLGRKVAAPV